jgi:hypothetical protein
VSESWGKENELDKNDSKGKVRRAERTLKAVPLSLPVRAPLTLSNIPNLDARIISAGDKLVSPREADFGR